MQPKAIKFLVFRFPWLPFNNFTAKRIHFFYIFINICTYDPAWPITFFRNASTYNIGKFSKNDKKTFSYVFISYLYGTTQWIFFSNGRERGGGKYPWWITYIILQKKLRVVRVQSENILKTNLECFILQEKKNLLTIFSITTLVEYSKTNHLTADTGFSEHNRIVFRKCIRFEMLGDEFIIINRIILWNKGHGKRKISENNG